MDLQIQSHDEIVRLARHCWQHGGKPPYAPGTIEHDIWMREYARLAGEAAVKQELNRRQKEGAGYA